MLKKYSRYGIVGVLSLVCVIGVLLGVGSAKKDESGSQAVTAGTSVREVAGVTVPELTDNSVSNAVSSPAPGGLPVTEPAQTDDESGKADSPEVTSGQPGKPVSFPELAPIVKPGGDRNIFFTTPATTTAEVTTVPATTKAETAKPVTTKAETTKKVTTAEPVIEAPDTGEGANADNGTKVIEQGSGQSLVDYFLEIAHNEIGVKETKYNCVKYNNWYYGVNVKGRTQTAYSWCVVFVSWCADQAGISTSYIPKISSVESMRSFYNSRGLFTRRSSADPRPGDIIFLGKSRPTHIGIVYEVSDGYVYTIEGNASDQVKMNTYKLSDSNIYGYARPECFK